MIKSLIEKAIIILKKELQVMPNKPGVYRMIDESGKVLYIGKAKDLSKRVSNYTQINRLCQRMKLAISQTTQLEIITTNTEAQALVLEANLIKSLKPKYNILLTDDKSMPYILLRQDHNFNQLIKFRGKRDIKGQYFGPFASPKIVDDTINFLEKTFLLRNCSDSYFSNRKHACLQYQLKRCSAPCVNKITQHDYQINVKQALDFLQGRAANLQQDLSSLMEEESNKMEYEKAAKYRDQLRALNYIQNKNANLFNLENADVIGLAKIGDLACIQLFLFRNGQNYGNRCFFFEQVQDEDIEIILTLFIAQFYQENSFSKEIIVNCTPENKDELEEAFTLKITTKLKGDDLKASVFATDNAKEAISRKYQEKQKIEETLKEVQNLFKIQNTIKRIEVYDNSHIMGAHAIGAMIVAGPDGYSKKHYRKYNIKTTDSGDDYAMVREVLRRRLLKAQDYPDLLLIDGGEGQLTSAQSILDELNLTIPLVCISKGVQRNSGRETFHQTDKPPFTLDKSLAVMKYLQILRDEAHRFAITGHRKKRTKAIGFSSLDEIPGIGSKRRKMLINHFTSIQEIKEATIEQLKMVEGFNKKTSEEVFNYFH